MAVSKIKINIYNKQKLLKPPRFMLRSIRRCCVALFQDEGISFPVELDVTFLDNSQIQKLNFEYRNKDFATDVLAFPLGENGIYDINKETGRAMLGDIVISLEKAKAQSEIYNHSLEREVCFLVVHALLHLFGYDHENAKGADVAKMREREEKILADIGLSKGTSYTV